MMQDPTLSGGADARLLGPGAEADAIEEIEHGGQFYRLPRALKASRQLHTGSQQRRQQQREAAKALRQQLTVGDSARKRRAHRGRQRVSE